MNATEQRAVSVEFRWTTSRGRDTYGYTICTLYVDGDRVARCNGGGYDMKGTCFGNFLASHYADRLRALKPTAMPEQSHWQRAENPRRVCRNTACVLSMIEGGKELEHYAADVETCPHCGAETDIDHRDGQRVDDGRYFYGLRFVDPNYDAGKAVIGEDCNDRTLSKESAEGLTVEQAEEKGISFGLERLQAAYRRTSPHATETHTEPSIDGACGMSSVEAIARAIGIGLQWVPGRRNRRDDLYILRDNQAE